MTSTFESLMRSRIMAGRKRFADLRAKMTPKAQARAKEAANKLNAEMDLAELRRAMKLSQEEIAAVLHVSQGAVAKMEKRADMLVGTLRRFVQAMGGDLELVARFADRSVRIETFGSLSTETRPIDERRA
jgi:DNA-binding transcriptional regulator YiaG